MKPKNIMLLGFVNKAVDYLEKHMDEEPDTRLAELKNIDLSSLRDELSDYLDSSLGTMQSTMSTLLKAGNEAFDQFMKVNHKENISDQFNRMLDVDFNDEKKTTQEELAKLLSFYNLEDFDTENTEEVDLPQDSNIDEYHLDENVEISEDDLFMEEIKKNIANDFVEDKTHIDSNETDPEIDTIFTEIVKNEGKSLDTIENQPTKIEAPIFKEVDIEEKVETKDDSKKSDGLPLDNSEIDDIKLDNSKIIESQNEELVVEETPKEETKAYFNTLIDELREQMIKEDAARKEEEKRDKEIYESVHEIYPNLSEEFVKSAYSLKQPLANDYPANKRLIILHRISFDDVDNLRKFVEIGLNHDYTINADEKKLIVDILKEFVNTDGKILNNIFEIANQGSILNGKYEGYNIIVNE